MKREKITDLKKIEELYKSGKISRSTFWRAKKRGYIVYHYHSKQMGFLEIVLEKEEN